MNPTIVNELARYANPAKISDYKRFFKTGIGEYGEGDQFLGIKVPDTRKVVKKYFRTMSLNEIQEFLYSPYHEHRLFALLVLVALYQAKDLDNKATIYHFYLNHTAQINNWDLIDVTSPHIVGAYLLDKERSLLYRLAASDNLWEKRIAIISTFAFIKAGEFEDTFAIANILLNDTHDLIHKAVGWAIREVGNRDKEAMIAYLNPRYQKMPRTMLRYAIEKLDEDLRQKYLKGLV
ncbi:MAG: DNA alkylation repair protein [Campylobacterales bacterium]|nr:DNA alkylation repair protein [Campylobacterales bacterium]